MTIVITFFDPRHIDVVATKVVVVDDPIPKHFDSTNPCPLPVNSISPNVENPTSNLEHLNIGDVFRASPHEEGGK